jgi:hypothetical protein
MRYLKILILLTFSNTVISQNDIGDFEIISKNKIKALRIYNCLENSNCYSDYYEFGKCGKIILEQPAMIGYYFKYEYNENCRIKFKYGMSNGHGPDNIWTKTEYHYNEVDSINYRIRVEFDKEGLVYNLDTLYGASESTRFKALNIIKNKNGQLIQHDCGELHYPCGIFFKGNHIVKYEYQDNGLISKAVIFNEKGNIIVDLTYEYIKT